MDYRILMMDTVSVGMQAVTNLPVWRECGYTIAGRSADIKRTIQAAADQDFDAILCIHHPGGQTAAELLTRLQKRALHIPVLVFSQQEDAGCMRKCFLLGCVDFLSEPVTEDDIRSSLERVTSLLREQSKNQEYAAALTDALNRLKEEGVQESLTEQLESFYRETDETAVTTDAAAEYFGFHKDYFSRYFKLRTGMTFSEFHKNVQMEYAKLLLLTGHFKVQDVSDLLGFSTADYFTRAFKKRIGKTPSEFKKN